MARESLGQKVFLFFCSTYLHYANIISMDVAKELRVGIALTIVYILILGYLVYANSHPSKPAPSQVQTQNLSSYTVSDVAGHNNQNDCWLIISNKVYNATDYLNIHPGGAQMIIPYCGMDATAAFYSIAKHDSRAQSALSTIIIGSIK